MFSQALVNMCFEIIDIAGPNLDFNMMGISKCHMLCVYEFIPQGVGISFVLPVFASSAVQSHSHGRHTRVFRLLFTLNISCMILYNISAASAPMVEG